jgi:hypothetical protein
MTTVDFFITSSAETEDPQAALTSKKKKITAINTFDV